MADRQNRIFSNDGGPKPPSPLQEIVAAQSKPRKTLLGQLWDGVKAVAVVVPLIVLSWAFIGDRFLPPSLTYPVIMGWRDGKQEGEKNKAAVQGTVEANNAITAGTAAAQADAQKTQIERTAAAQADAQNTQIQRTTDAQVNLAAETQAATIRRTSPLQEISTCRTELATQAAQKVATCIGTGVSGGECAGRGDIDIDALCGKIDADPNAALSQPEVPAQ